jgi:hypothetical protein
LADIIIAIATADSREVAALKEMDGTRSSGLSPNQARYVQRQE